MDYEIEEARKQAVQTLEEINREIDVDYSELVRWDEEWIETWKVSKVGKWTLFLTKNHHLIK